MHQFACVCSILFEWFAFLSSYASCHDAAIGQLEKSNFLYFSLFFVAFFNSIDSINDTDTDTQSENNFLLFFNRMFYIDKLSALTFYLCLP